MKKMKRMIAFVLFLALFISLLPPIQIAKAADVSMRYELDTDGIDVGATYLIVNTGNTGSANALKFYYQNTTRDFRNQTLTIKSSDGVTYIDTGFTDEADCQFQFTSNSYGKITHGDYSMDLRNSRYVSGASSGNSMTFTNAGNGQYRIQYPYGIRTYYLRYYNSDWTGNTSTSSVYLFKLTEYEAGYDVNYDGNGHTSGKLPNNAEKIAAGEQYTVLAPTNLRKDIGEDTWLFQCWNTAADGSGTEYNPGETITMTADTTLYAQWYQQTKHTISMITYLDGVATDVDKFAGYDRHFYAVLEGGDGTYITLTRREEGTYSAKVVENGTYVIYAITADGQYEQVHGHKVIVYNQTGTTECMHYSVTYDVNGGAWTEGEAPAAEIHHYGEAVTAHDKIPVREGFRFVGWEDQDGKQYTAGQLITEQVDKKLVLTAVWEEKINVTVNVVIDHNAVSSGKDNNSTKHDLTFTLLREENGANLLVEEKTLTSGYTYDQETNTTTYQVVFEGLPQGIYHVLGVKSNYESTFTYEGGAAENQTITINLQYAPDNFDFTFDVEVLADTEAEKALMPQAVNVKVSYWGYDENDVLDWHIITQQSGDNAPTTIYIDENGKGSGFFPVWQYWSDTEQAYDYRVEVTSFIMPDGTIVPASGDKLIYTADGSGLYTATVFVGGESRVPSYPDGSDTELEGAYYDGEKQQGDVKVVVDITPFTVTFHAGNGLVNGQNQIVLENQYRYPSLREYIAVPNEEGKLFTCWVDENGNPVTDLGGQLLTGNVTYTARYNENITISGTVTADATYEQDGKTVFIHDIDRVDTVLVVLQKKVGDVYNDIESVAVSLVYPKGEDLNETSVGVGEYTFANLPNDGTEYRVHLLVNNYQGTYDHNQDGTYAEEEAVALIDTMTITSQVDVHLAFVPDAYVQELRVDASQIHEDLRPTAVLAQILYRDLGDVHHYQVISQHTVEPYGIKMDLDPADASANAEYAVWNWHTDGAPYEYQAQVFMVYGNDVPGAYSKEGLEYNNDRPYTVVYGPSNNYLQQTAENGVALEAMLVPKTYHVHLDLNLGNDLATPVYGLEEYMVDDLGCNAEYAFEHTWSYTEQFTAYPYREGYVFKGWSSPNTDDVYIKDGVVHVGNTLANHITLTAQWEKMSGTDYTIRYLELNTDKVLKGATMVSGAVLGDRVSATAHAVALEGYVYAGAMVDGIYVDKTKNPVMVVSEDPIDNLMVIYYLPDGSDGYTEQVESNLEINKTAVLEDNGTYTITMDTFTKDNPITTLIQQNTPLDIVLVLDQSGSMYTGNAVDDLKDATENFIGLIADHGRENKVDHRIAVVGYASDQYSGYTNYYYPTAGKDGTMWVNTGVFDSNGDFHIYPVTGFNYTPYTGTITSTGTYYTYAEGEYMLLTYHENYRHLITAEEARVEALNGTPVYGYVDGQFVEVTRNSSGLWLYGDKLLYSAEEFFTYHTDVWTHRHGLERREIHAYGLGADYHVVGAHKGVYTRSETREANPQKSIYADALVPVSVGAHGSGAVTPGLLKATSNIGANGETFVSYGIEMANSIFEANPLDPEEGRIRIMVVFTDGKPGDSSNFDEFESNKALELSYITTHTHNAKVYTIGMYGDTVVAAESDQDFFMNGLSSNYPDAQHMDDVWVSVTYQPATSGYRLDNGGPYFVSVDGQYRMLSRKSVYENKTYYLHWGYTDDAGAFVPIYIGLVADGQPVITNNMVGDYVIYRRYGNGYQDTPYSGYYTVADDHTQLQRYFADVVQSITTTVTTEIVLESDTILRDIMNQGLVLTDGTVITVYTQEGNYNLDTGDIDWSDTLVEMVKLELGSGNTMAEGPSLGVDENGQPKGGVKIITYNLDAANATDPSKANYHPHAVDITGYDFHEWYISESHTKGYKMVVTITRVEARDDVQWGRSTATNNDQSGLWLPEDKNGNRQLLLPFDQPTTIFVERAYVLDYGKEFTLSGWYFDDEYDEETDEKTKDATAIHVDCDVTNGMNWFDPANPNTTNVIGGQYGNTKYGNVQVKDGEVTYTPTTMNWNGYDQFYVFGETWRQTVLAQDANENGNLWNKITVIPANNIYYEDSFVTTEDTTQNGVEGFVFTGAWTVVGEDGGNVELPEKNESTPYGDVHGWTNFLCDDQDFTDGTAHATGLNKEIGAKSEFTFTGTGVEVYTRTNADSGMVVAMLNRVVEDGNGNQTTTLYKSIAMDNLAVSGDYYHIPTVAFKDLPYGTYKLQLIATVASTATGTKRYEYYIDGVRIHNPLGNTTNYQSDVVKDAYGLENNAVFTEVRDILLDYGDFNVSLPDSTDGKMGAVFIDWIQVGQGSSNDKPGVGVPTYKVGTFEELGPKNEVYLSAGQAVVMKVDESNTYFIGLKSLTGKEVAVNLSGADQADPTTIKLSHTTDLYYRVTPVNGYIVIQNANTDDQILSITNLRTTNITKPATNGGVLPVASEEAEEIVGDIFIDLLLKKNQTENPEPSEPEEEKPPIPSAEEQAQANWQRAQELFTTVRRWLEIE